MIMCVSIFCCHLFRVDNVYDLLFLVLLRPLQCRLMAVAEFAALIGCASLLTMVVPVMMVVVTVLSAA